MYNKLGLLMAVSGFPLAAYVSNPRPIIDKFFMRKKNAKNFVE